LVGQRDVNVTSQFRAVKEVRNKSGQEHGLVVAVGEAEDLTQLEFFFIFLVVINN
jgi:hypothetical protein